MIHPLFWLFSFETFFNVNSLPFWNYMISSKEGGKSKIGVVVGTHPFSVIGDRDGGLRYMIVQTREWVCNPMYFQPLLALGAAKNIPPNPPPYIPPLLLSILRKRTTDTIYTASELSLISFSLHSPFLSFSRFHI